MKRSKISIRRIIIHALGSAGKGIKLLTPQERRLAGLLALTSIVNGMLQTVTIIALVPILHFLMDPGVELSANIPEWVMEWTPRKGNDETMLWLVAGLAVLVTIKTIFSWLQLGWMARFSSKCEVRLNSYLMNRVIASPYSWLVRQNTARLRQLVFGYVASWSRGFVRTIMGLMNQLLLMGFIVAALIWANPVVGLFGTVAIMLGGVVIFSVIKPRLLKLAHMKRQAILHANEISTVAVLGIKDVKMAGAERYFGKVFDGHLSQYAFADAAGQQWGQLPKHIIELVVYFILVGICVFVVLSGARDNEIAGMLLLYGLALMRLMPAFTTVISSFSTLVGSFPQIDDLEELIASTATSELQPDGNMIYPNWREVQLNEISLYFPGAELPALDQVSLKVLRGRSYGVVGQSGAGKSTMVDVLVGLLEPSQGSLSADGQLIVSDQLRAWRQHFGYVAQRPFLLDSSLRDNIVFNSVTPSDESRLWKAISLARLEGVVSRLADGVDTRMGEMGAFLSGGERQRVAIARALYRGADILILDEATSSLDTITEREITESIEALRGDVTTITISHSLEFVRGCDEIWVFDNARFVAHGTHDQLLDTSELYQRMMADQGNIRSAP